MCSMSEAEDCSTTTADKDFVGASAATAWDMRLENATWPKARAKAGTVKIGSTVARVDRTGSMARALARASARVSPGAKDIR